MDGIDAVLDRLFKNATLEAAGRGANPPVLNQPPVQAKIAPSLAPVVGGVGTLPPQPVGTQINLDYFSHFQNVMSPVSERVTVTEPVTTPEVWPERQITMAPSPPRVTMGPTMFPGKEGGVFTGQIPESMIPESEKGALQFDEQGNPINPPPTAPESWLQTLARKETTAFGALVADIMQKGARIPGVKQFSEWYSTPHPVPAFISRYGEVTPSEVLESPEGQAAMNALIAASGPMGVFKNFEAGVKQAALETRAVAGKVPGAVSELATSEAGFARLGKEGKAIPKAEAVKPTTPIPEAKPPAIEAPLVKEPVASEGVPPVKPPVPPMATGAVAPPPDPRAIIREYLANPQRLAEASRQKEITSTQRAIRINERFAPKLEELLAKGTEPEIAIKMASQEMTGEMAKFKTALGDLIPDDMRSALYNTVIEKYGLNDYRTLAASEALTKALAGKPIPNIPGSKGGSALKLLQETFADNPEVIDMLKNQDDFLLKLGRAKPPQEVNFQMFPEGTVGKQLAIIPPSGRERAVNALKSAGINTLDAINLPRALIASFDLSAAGRQGLVLSTSHPIAAAKAFGKQIRALFSEKNAAALEKEIKSRPFTRLSIGKNELYIAERNAKLTAREETWASRFARHIPGIRASERAYLTFLNDLRSQVYEQGARSLQKLNATPKDYKELAEFINWSTGRGSLPKTLQGTASVMNALLFSPRLILARLQLPTKLLSTSAYTRKEAWRALGTFLAFGGSMVGLGYLATGKKPDFDPRSADFGKVRVGDTRLDFWGGYLQYLRFASQLITGESKTEAGNIRPINRWEVIQRFSQSKGAPGFGLLQDILAGETYMGEEMSTSSESLKKQAYSRLTPLFIQDMIDAIGQEGLPGLVALSSGLGVGVVTYVDPLQKARNDKAQQIYGMSYDDVGQRLNKAAQIAIDKSSPEIQKLKEEQDKAFSRTVTGKTDPNNLYYQQGKIIEKGYQDSIANAVAELKVTGNGEQFRDKVNTIAKVRTGAYDTLNNTPSFKDIVDRFNQPLSPEQMAKMNPDDIARLAYNKMLYSDDMYDQFGNYKFDEVDKRRQQFASQFGQDALAYVDQYRGVKEAELPVEYQALKADQKVLRPYWDIMENYPTEEQAAQKQLYRLGDIQADAALNLWGYASVASTPKSLELLQQKVTQLGLDPATIKALAPEKTDINNMWDNTLSFVPKYYREFLWDKGGYETPKLRDIAEKILAAKQEDKPKIDEYDDTNEFLREKFRSQNPEVDVALNIWGRVATVKSQKALDLLKKRANDLGIPFEALPISPQYKKQQAQKEATEKKAALSKSPAASTESNFLMEKLQKYGLK